jgi:hypothetical protein
VHHSATNRRHRVQPGPLDGRPVKLLRTNRFTHGKVIVGWLCPRRESIKVSDPVFSSEGKPQDPPCSMTALSMDQNQAISLNMIIGKLTFDME